MTWARTYTCAVLSTFNAVNCHDIPYCDAVEEKPLLQVAAGTLSRVSATLAVLRVTTKTAACAVVQCVTGKAHVHCIQERGGGDGAGQPVTNVAV